VCERKERTKERKGIKKKRKELVVSKCESQHASPLNEEVARLRKENNYKNELKKMEKLENGKQT
jgi:hypothetical protein